MTYNDLRKGRLSESNREYFITFNVHQRNPAFNDFYRARKFIQILNNANTASKWLAWVLMPDHFHGLLQLHSNDQLSIVIGQLKGKAAKSINPTSGQQFWQSNFFDRALRKHEDRKQVARYIIANPLRAGLVSNIGDYPHWDCVWL